MVTSWLRDPRFWIGTVVLGTIALVLRGRASEGGAEGGWFQGPFVGPNDRVLLAGDSLAAGLTKPMGELAKQAGIAFKGHGVVGSRIDEWDSKYLEPELGESGTLSFAPTVVVLSLGTNDMKMFDPSKQQKARVQSVIDKVRAAGARVVWIIPPTMPFDDKGVRAMLEAAGADMVIHAERLELARAPDQIHMTPSGYGVFAKHVWDCLTGNGCP